MIRNQEDKTLANKSQSVFAENSSSEIDENLFEYEDNRSSTVAQRKLQENADESLIVNRTSQLQAIADNFTQHNNLIQRKENNTGLPDNLKSGIENMLKYYIPEIKSVEAIN